MTFHDRILALLLPPFRRSYQQNHNYASMQNDRQRLQMCETGDTHGAREKKWV